nr:putative SWI/SNF-related matrix-associated actin-dependent regulator of chromatin subfamily A member 3-like 1 [Coffea arabica]
MTAAIDPVDEFLNLDAWPLSPEEDYSSSGNDSGDQRHSHHRDLPFSQSSISSSSSSSSPHSPGESYMVGFLIVNVVGIQYYNGTINGREMVGLVREPLNAYDENAIKVLNTRSVQVGHIERMAAKVLAPMIDSRLIAVEGIVPKASARFNRYKIPCQVHIFARIEAFDAVKSNIAAAGLQLISENNASFALSEAAVVRQRRAGEGEKSVDEIFKLLDEKIGQTRALAALEPPKDVIKSELLLHQKEGLAWLVQRENCLELPPFWEERGGAYVNVLTNYMTDEKPEPLRGGIFADDMGLGKTLTLLSLIAFDKFHGPGPSSVDTGDGDVGKELELKEEEVIVVIDKRSKRQKGSKGTNTQQMRLKTEVVDAGDIKVKSKCSSDPHNSVVSRTTLIVCPPSVFSSWVNQLGEHTIPGRLKVYMYYGERTKDANVLQAYDIVLTTYTTLAAEDPWEDSPVKKIEWRRIILDEAHLIKNINALQSRAVTKLNAKRRWLVTGTPIQNHSFDLFSLMAFLRFEPLSIKNYWNNLIARPLASGDEKGISRLQVLMAAISLRRTKDKALVGLPSKSVETLLVDLSAEERDVYDKMESEARKVITHYISGDTLVRNYSTVLSILVRLRQVCNALALCPPDIRELLPSLEDVKKEPKLLEKMLSVLQEGEDFDCPICISPPRNAVITCCAHIFCQSCILKTIRRSNPSCPLCRHPLSDSDLFQAPPNLSETEDTPESSSFSSKVAVLLQLLSASRDHSPTTKSVVFSQFQKMLLLLEEPLKALGFRLLRLDGSMNAKKRAKVLKEFDVPAPEGPTILLASLKASGVGINLTAASRVYLIEPWWNPAIEEQAMDRIHRIGQKEDVKIVRLIAKETVEERILALQEQKKLLARKAFGRRVPQGQREISKEDLVTLMCL